LNSGCPFIKRGQGETPQSEQPAERIKKIPGYNVPTATNPPQNSRAKVEVSFQFSNHTIAALRATPGL